MFSTICEFVRYFSGALRTESTPPCAELQQQILLYKNKSFVAHPGTAKRARKHGPTLPHTQRHKSTSTNTPRRDTGGTYLDTMVADHVAKRRASMLALARRIPGLLSPDDLVSTGESEICRLLLERKSKSTLFSARRSPFPFGFP